MRSGGKSPDELTQWVEKAEEDLTVAAHLLKLGVAGPLSTVCFHAQQSIEKYIKAVLLAQGTAFPKTHDLTKLVALLPEAARPSLSANTQERLTDYATVLRYPGDEEPVTLAEARHVVAAARRVRQEMRRLLPRSVLRRRRS